MKQFTFVMACLPFMLFCSDAVSKDATDNKKGVKSGGVGVKSAVALKGSMRITASAVSLNVDNVAASSQFFKKHFGFREKMAAPGFSSLVRDDTALNVIFLKRGIEVLPKNFRDQRASGVILAFTVVNIAAEETRLRREGVKISMPLRTETWGETLFQVTDPNGVIIELVEWTTPKKK